MTLILPAGVSQRMQQERQLRAAALRASVELHDKLAHWNKQLREIDRDLQLVKAREDTEHPDLKPGYYHLLRHTPGAPPTVIIHQGPNGEFREPDSALFEELKKADMWSDRANAERRRVKKAVKLAEQRARAAEAEERRENIKDLYRHRYITKAAFPKVPG